MEKNKFENIKKIMEKNSLPLDKNCKNCGIEIINNKTRVFCSAECSIEYPKTPNGKFEGYEKSAISRKHEYSISKEQFLTFWRKPCSYCGADIKTIGIDRENNKVGYIMSNLVSCCGFCNHMKFNLSKENFLKQVKKIYDYNHMPNKS